MTGRTKYKMQGQSKTKSRLTDGVTSQEAELKGLDSLSSKLTDTPSPELGQQQYWPLFEHNPDAVYSLDLEGHFVELNPACEKISGYTREELVKRVLSYFGRSRGSGTDNGFL